jgi:DNA-binding IclR family transcriptional regulator
MIVAPNNIWLRANTVMMPGSFGFCAMNGTCGETSSMQYGRTVMSTAPIIDPALIVLGVEKGIYIEYVETIRSTEGMQLYIAPGTQRLTVQSVMGWHFLSTYADEHAHEIYRATIKRGELAKSEFSLDQLMRRVRRHRELDISFIAARDLVRPAAHWGSGMVTMMVPISAGHRKLGIGVGGPADRLAQKLDLISECLRLEATEIARHVAESDAAAG